MITSNQIGGVVRQVQTRLDAKGRERSIELRVEEQDYRLEDDWLYISITPTAPGYRVADYAEILGEIEQELRLEGIDNVLLVPAIGH